MIPYVCRSTYGHILSLAPRLRAEDVAEVRALVGIGPHEALYRSYRDSDTRLTMIGTDGEPVAMFGCGPLEGGAGFIWMLAADTLTEKANQIPFLRQCKGYVQQFHRAYPVLRNVVDERNSVHIKWLKWIGCEFTGRIEAHGIERRPFLEFIHKED